MICKRNHEDLIIRFNKRCFHCVNVASTCWSSLQIVIYLKF